MKSNILTLLFLSIFFTLRICAEDFIEEPTEDKNVDVEKVNFHKKALGSTQNKKEEISTNDEGEVFDESSNNEDARIEKKYQSKKTDKNIHPLDYETISDIDQTMGVKKEIHFFDEDMGRFSAGILANPEPQALSNHLGLEGSYSHKLENFWLDLFFEIDRTQFGAISHNVNFSSKNTTSEGQHIHRDNENINLTSFGVGVSYRMPFFFWSEYRFFQMMGAGANYIGVFNQATAQSYQGIGLKTYYTVEHRLTSNFFYAIKFNYTLDMVQRSQLTSSEDHRDRRLYLSWISVGFSLGLYY